MVLPFFFRIFTTLPVFRFCRRNSRSGAESHGNNSESRGSRRYMTDTHLSGGPCRLFHRLSRRLAALAPRTLRVRMLLLTATVVTVSILAMGFVAGRIAHEALLGEKQEKLFGMTRLLDTALGEGFDSILQRWHVAGAGREAQVEILNRTLSAAADDVAAAYPGSAVGYYDRRLDAVVAYAPSDKYANHVGMALPPGHPGHRAMAEGRQLLESGPLVRGNVMNAMLPVVRGGRIEGYIWANELTDDIQHQLQALDRGIFLVMALALLFCWTSIVYLSSRMADQINIIKGGVQRLRYDWEARIPEPPGELGEIARVINAMALSLRDAQTFSDHILHSTADGIITIDTDGRISTINPAAQRMTGFVLENVVGLRYAELFSGSPSFRSLLLDALSSGRPHIAVETDYPTAHGLLRVRASANQLRDADRRVIGAMATFQDITKEHEMTRQVRRAERLATLGELMAGVAHEIRNPLTAIRGFGQYLQQTEDPKEYRKYIPVIVNEVDAVNRFIQELLDFARPPRPYRQTVRLGDLARDTLRLAQTGNDARRIEFHLDIEEHLPPIEADAEQIKQALLNLLLNAVQAIAGAGRVDIRLFHDAAGDIGVEVRDTGCGITAENLPKLFDPFFTTKSNGTGLGMAMVQRVLTAHRGHIDIASVPGRGTTVTMTLPAHPPEPAATP